MFRVVTTVLDDNNRRRLVVRGKYERIEDARSAKDAMNKVAEARGRVPSYAVVEEDSYRLLRILFQPKKQTKEVKDVHELVVAQILSQPKEKTHAAHKRAKRQATPGRS